MMRSLRNLSCILMFLWLGHGKPSSALAQQVVEARRFAVASGHPDATEAGMTILQRGGNVVDAAIATSLALGVAEPYGSGLGGKLVWLYRDGKTGEIHSITALCAAPAELDVEQFIGLSSDQRKYGYKSAGVPGLVAGLEEAHRRWGTLTWTELAEPAAALAERGILIDATMQALYRPHVDDLARDEEAASLYLYRGGLPPVGARLKNADLAGVLRHIGTEGPRWFYEGPVARQLVAASQREGAALTLDDLKNYRVDVSRPLHIDFAGYQVYSCPPPLTGGATALAALKAWQSDSRPIATSTDYADRMARLLLRLYPRVQRDLADVPTAQAAAEALLSDAMARQIADEARRVDPADPYSAATPDPADPAEAEPASSTTHLVVADAEGNMVSLTQSLSLHFGAAVVAPGTGFLLNDSLSNF
ncbi:MAG: gamma-glutamyltransferase, partial [Planctomycetales bacterium]|nr:gamma-glutamyltransferase [Planctomycetales bacterium]